MCEELIKVSKNRSRYASDTVAELASRVEVKARIPVSDEYHNQDPDYSVPV